MGSVAGQRKEKGNVSGLGFSSRSLTSNMKGMIMSRGLLWGMAIWPVWMVSFGPSLLAAAHHHPSLAEDPALQEEVTFSASGRSVEEVLDELGQANGVALHADDEVKELKVTIRVRGVKLGHLLDHLAQLFNCQWILSEQEGYVLSATWERRRLSAKLRELSEDLMGNQIVQLIQEVSQKGPPSWLVEDLPMEEQERFGQQFRDRARVLATLSTYQLTRLLLGERRCWRIRELEEQQQPIIVEFARKYANLEEPILQNALIEFSSEVYVPPIFPLPLRKVKFTLLTDRGQPLSSYDIVVNPYHYLKAVFAAAERFAPQEGTGDKETLEDTLGEALPDSLAFFEADLVTFDQVIRKIAEECDINIIGDFFSEQPIPAPKIGKPIQQNLEQALETVAQHYGRRWKTVEDCFLWRKKTWWLDEAAETPNSMLQRWQESVKERGGLSLDDVAEVAQLSDYQLARLVWNLPQAIFLREGVVAPFLRAFFGLEGWHKALGEDGLPMEEIPFSAQEQMSFLIDWERWVEGRLYLTVEETPEQYNLVFQTGKEGEEPIPLIRIPLKAPQFPGGFEAKQP